MITTSDANYRIEFGWNRPIKDFYFVPVAFVEVDKVRIELFYATSTPLFGLIVTRQANFTHLVSSGAIKHYRLQTVDNTDFPKIKFSHAIFIYFDLKDNLSKKSQTCDYYFNLICAMGRFCTTSPNAAISTAEFRQL